MANESTVTAAVKFTVHGVLAGAYRGRVLERSLLTHVSADGGETALCGKVREGSLCDELVDETASCTVCARRLERLAKLDHALQHLQRWPAHP